MRKSLKAPPTTQILTPIFSARLKITLILLSISKKFLNSFLIIQIPFYFEKFPSLTLPSINVGG